MKKGYAVGAFNCPNMESVMAIIQAAEETNSPVILNYAEVHNCKHLKHTKRSRRSLPAPFCMF